MALLQETFSRPCCSRRCFRRCGSSGEGGPGEHAALEAEVLAYLVLGALARRDEEPLLRPKLHYFVQGLDGLWLRWGDGNDRRRLAFDGRERLGRSLSRWRFVAPAASITSGRPGAKRGLSTATGDGRRRVRSSRARTTVEGHEGKRRTFSLPAGPTASSAKRRRSTTGAPGADGSVVSAARSTISPPSACFGRSAAATGGSSSCCSLPRAGSPVRGLCRPEQRAEPGGHGGAVDRGLRRDGARADRARLDAGAAAPKGPRLRRFPAGRRLPGRLDGGRSLRFRVRHLAFTVLRESPDREWYFKKLVDEVADRATEQGLVPAKGAGREPAVGRLRWLLVEELFAASERQRRNSLEQLGLAEVRYEGLSGSAFDSLANRWAPRLGVTREELLGFVELILDGFRLQHAVSHAMLGRLWNDRDPEVRQGIVNVPDHFRPKLLVPQNPSDPRQAAYCIPFTSNRASSGVQRFLARSFPEASKSLRGELADQLLGLARLRGDPPAGPSQDPPAREARSTRRNRSRLAARPRSRPDSPCRRPLRLQPVRHGPGPLGPRRRLSEGQLPRDARTAPA